MPKNLCNQNLYVVLIENRARYYTIPKYLGIMSAKMEPKALLT